MLKRFPAEVCDEFNQFDVNCLSCVNNHAPMSIGGIFYCHCHGMRSIILIRRWNDELSD